MRDKRLLWQHLPLPAWNPQRLFDLFLLHTQGSPSSTERDEYAMLLMVCISANMSRGKWFLHLRRRRIDPEDAASDVLSVLVKKTPSIRLAYPCVQVLLKVLNVSIYRLLVGFLRQQRLHVEELPSADEAQPSCGEELFIEHLALRLREAEPIICRGPWSDQIAVCVLYRYLCRQLLRQNTILSYPQLPERLQQRISLEQHALIAYRLNKLICAFAADAR